MSDIHSVWFKIERAKKHIRDLESAWTVFLDTNPYRAVPKYNPKIGQTEYHLVHFRAVSPVIPALAGDAIHNLRSAWDHLAYHFAVAAGITDPVILRKVCFPIGESKRNTKESLIEK